MLWHGCTATDALAIFRNGIDIAVCRPDADFGKGFYLTTIEQQARQWAWRRYYESLPSRQAANQPAILRFRVMRHRLAKLESLHSVLGDYEAEAFWSLVQHCRQSTIASVRHHELPDSAKAGWYDMASGPVAAFWKQRVAMLGSDQISVHTAAAAGVLNELIQGGNVADACWELVS